MIKIEHTETYGWDAAIRGMRNPMNSWDKSDTDWCWYWETQKDRIDYDSEGYVKVVGDNDLDLMKRLAQGGPVHAKYRRMITVTCDITAPLYWFKEYDTYKVGTVANSCSTMHRIHSRDLTLHDFSHEWLEKEMEEILLQVISAINYLRNSFCEYNHKDDWYQMIQLLPSSYNQKRTVQLNYEVLTAMYRDRRNHKLDEWHDFCDWIESLPYSELITGARNG